MKRGMLFLCGFFAIASLARAHIQPPITAYITLSKTVFIAKVVAVHDKVITFSVEEVLKGKPNAFLNLIARDLRGPITEGSEWLLASAGHDDHTLGWAMEGNDAWVNAPVRRLNGEPYLVGNWANVDPEVDKDISKGMSLEQLKELAKKPFTNDLLMKKLPLSH